MIPKLNDEGVNRYFEIERHRTRNARDLPFWRVQISTPTLSQNTKIGVTYFYKSVSVGYYRELQNPYDDDHLEVRILGANRSIDKDRAAPLPEPTKVDEAYKTMYGTMPGYHPTIEFKPESFIGRSDELVPHMVAHPEEI